MRFTLDTNILVYAVDRNAGDRHRRAIEIVRGARDRDCVITLQALAELFRALTRPRLGVPPEEARVIVDTWTAAISVVTADEACLSDAMDMVIDHRWSFWDAMMWATAIRHGCGFLLSEDGQSGRVLGGVTIVNPFTPEGAERVRTELGVTLSI